MTATSLPSRTKNNSINWSVILNPIVIVNLSLVCLLVVGFAYYMASVNAVASGGYDILNKRASISKLIESQGLLSSEKTATENPVAALFFAQSQNMTEAKDIVYVFENGEVALQR